MSDATRHRGVDDSIEVRVLGGLRVRRPDGSLVQPREFRTSKTLDLVLLLALQVGRPVPVDRVLEVLWPDVPAQRGNASLRTACSQVRHVLGPEVVQRRLGGLELCGVWVDASRFRTLVSEVAQRAASADLAQTVRVAREADALYLGAVEAKLPGAPWIAPDAAALAALHHDACCAAAEAATGLGWMRDAVDFASRALTSDRYSERASRALMHGLAGLGEVPAALREYERCRSLLGEELGVDPSPATRALHLRLLRDDQTDVVPAAAEQAPFTGRVRERARLAAVLHERQRVGAGVVHLVGPAGSGRRRLLHEVSDGFDVRTIAQPGRRTGDTTARLSPAPVSGTRPRDRAFSSGQDDGRLPLLALVELGPGLQSGDAVQTVARVLEQQDRPWTLVVLSEQGPSQPWEALVPAGADAAVVRIELPPMTEDEVARLAGSVLGGAPTSAVLTELCEQSRQLPGRVVDIARDWLRTGRVVSTATGLTLLQQRQPGTAQGTSEHVLADVVGQLQEADLAVAQLLAVVDLPMPAARVVPLLADGNGPVRAAAEQVLPSLDRLVDLSVLRQTPGGYLFRDPQLQAAVLSWMRPAVRRVVHRRVAEQADLPPAHRIDQWLQAGEPERARAFAVTSGGAALADGRPEDARALLLRITSLGQLPASTPQDRIETFARLADACAALGRDEEAQDARAVVQRVAAAHELPAGPEQPASSSARAVQGVDVPVRRGSTRAAAETEWHLEVDEDPGDPDLSRRLRAAVDAADRDGDCEQGARARLRLTSAVCVPRRQFGLARRWTQEALRLSVDSSTRAQALVLAWWPGVLLGEAHLAEHALVEAAELARDAEHPALARRIAVVRRLVAHDLGRPAPADDLDPDPDLYDAPVRARIASEAGPAPLLRSPAAVLHEALPAPVSQLVLLAAAVQHAGQRRSDDAIALLTQVVDSGSRSGHTLLLPEAVARLIVLLCQTDLTRAHEQFELFDHLTGGAPGHPRESVLRLIARAAVRAAAGQDDAAAAAAAHAAEIASSHHLVHLLADAQRVRARHLDAAGRSSDARLARAEAARADGSGESTAVLRALPTQRLPAGPGRTAGPGAGGHVMPLKRRTGG